MHPIRPHEAATVNLRFHKPRKARVFYMGVALLTVGLTATLSGFTQSASRTERFTAFSNAGTFTYTAPTTHPDSLVYPSGVAHTGEELVIGDIDQVTMNFAYRFNSKLEHDIHGTITLQDVFLGDSGWRNAYKLVQPVAFTGDRASVTATMSLSGLTEVLAKLQAGSRVAARSYTVRLQPVIHYEGTVDDHPVHGTFAPTIPFTLDAAVFAPQALDLGASSQAQTLDSEFHPAQAGDLIRSRARWVTFARIHAPAFVFRFGGALVAALGLVIALRSQRRRRDDIWSNEKRTAHRAGRSLVDVIGLEQSVISGSAPIEIAAFESLVALAVQTERPILHEIRTDTELFAVEQASRVYVFRKRPSATLATAESPVAAARHETAPHAILRVPLLTSRRGD
ncbi:MAG TPA: hypothetical protein VG265_00700 [Gaiellaceae bacterium]|nr:hypothetical protein [Gaiellaceae bacterium]